MQKNIFKNYFKNGLNHKMLSLSRWNTIIFLMEDPFNSQQSLSSWPQLNDQPPLSSWPPLSSCSPLCSWQIKRSWQPLSSRPPSLLSQSGWADWASAHSVWLQICQITEYRLLHWTPHELTTTGRNKMKVENITK